MVAAAMDHGVLLAVMVVLITQAIISVDMVDGTVLLVT